MLDREAVAKRHRRNRATRPLPIGCDEQDRWRVEAGWALHPNLDPSPSRNKVIEVAQDSSVDLATLALDL